MACDEILHLTSTYGLDVPSIYIKSFNLFGADVGDLNVQKQQNILFLLRHTFQNPFYHVLAYIV